MCFIKGETKINYYEPFCDVSFSFLLLINNLNVRLDSFPFKKSRMNNFGHKSLHETRKRTSGRSKLSKKQYLEILRSCLPRQNRHLSIGVASICSGLQGPLHTFSPVTSKTHIPGSMTIFPFR